jgi:hypothetical protein
MWLACVAVALSACGDAADDAAATPSVPRTSQDPLALACDAKTPVCWDTELAKHPPLQALISQLGLPVQAAGQLQDASGTTLLWAELASSPEAARTDVRAVFARCAKGAACSYGQAAYTATGATFSDASGAPLSQVAVGRPVLRKKLKAHAPDKDPTLLAPLQDTAKPDAELVRQRLSQVADRQRRCVILNAYGPELGLDPAAIVTAAKNSGRFDRVDVIHYVRAADIELLLPSLTPLDAVIWLGAGVYEDRSEGPRLLGMTVSRGVFGDQLVYGKTFPDLLKVTPLGGPGLVVLAGAQSLAPNSWKDLNTLGYVLTDSGRAVVGFGATQLPPEQAISATAALLTQLGKGATLSAAMAASNPGFLANLEATAAGKWQLAAPSASFWSGKPPGKAAMKLHLRLDPPSCVAAGSVEVCDRTSWTEAYAKNAVAATELTAGHATFDCPSLQIEGPFFSCTAKDANTTADFQLRGVMRGTAEGDRFWLVADGTANLKYKQLLAIGEATWGKSDAGAGKTTVKFSGPAAAATWLDDEERCCTCKGLGALTTIKSEPSVVELWP